MYSPPCSVVSFLKSWNKNYRDINYMPYYTMCTEDKTSIVPGIWSGGMSLHCTVVLLFIWRRPFLAIWHFMSRDFPRLKDFSWLQEFPFLRLLSSQDFLSSRLPGHKVMFINNRIKYNFVRILDKNKTKTVRCLGRTYSIECLDNILFQEFCSWYYLNYMMVDLSIH